MKLYLGVVKGGGSFLNVLHTLLFLSWSWAIFTVFRVLRSVEDLFTSAYNTGSQAVKQEASL